MAYAVRNASDLERYEITADGELAGFAQYRERPGLIAFIHTEVDDRFAGRGIGSKLVAAALADVRERGLHVLPFCPFVNHYLVEHESDRDLVPAEHRERFGL